jgi:uncharacterized protein DUF3800
MSNIDSMFIYLDESGDLGFDWSKKSTTPYFIITLLVCYQNDTKNQIRKAVMRTLKQINHKKNKKRIVHELKGTSTALNIKKFFYKQMPDNGWEIFSVILNKRKVYNNLTTIQGKKKLYNFLSRFVIEKISFPETLKNVRLIVDRCKNTVDERKDFNTYLENQLEASIPNLNVIADIFHESSHENYELQAVDLFCWGIHRKITYEDLEWYSLFKEKIKILDVYLK